MKDERKVRKDGSSGLPRRAPEHKSRGGQGKEVERGEPQERAGARRAISLLFSGCSPLSATMRVLSGKASMDRTEPQREGSGCQRRMVYALFVMVPLLFVVQAVTLALVLTRHPPPPQNMPVGGVCRVPSQEVTMETGNSGEKKARISWTTSRANSEEPLIVQREDLVVNGSWDGRYFLYVRVTLQSSITQEGLHTLCVKQGAMTLLEVKFTWTDGVLTTGFLGRQVELYAGGIITVSCFPPAYINPTGTLTYLGVSLLQLNTQPNC
ncbi:hypothetical protein AAFF_G00198900 [Aldrovandia affinis]|uniref:TNF family profile domain-containing protein n=1 Tax=Aldrovandia affinis TaxID=143900 RepID=A0AAD7RIA3_9TELE|nr:hypothetical protein AAFF_G00198900 [Aldrovandia affinis]